MEDTAAARIDFQGLLRDPRTRYAAGFTLLFSVLAHAYRWTMTGFAHDALVIWQDEKLWQTALGRFLIPPYLLFRGELTPPLLIAAFAVAFLAVSAVLIVRILDIRSTAGIAALCGVMATHATLTDSYATYLPWTDIYMLSLLLSVLAVYVYVRFPLGWIPAAVLTALSMGLYPVYAQSAAVLCLLWLIRTCLAEKKTPFVFRRGCIAVAFLILGGILYYFLWRLSLILTGAETVSTPNSITGLSALLGYTPFQILSKVYRACMKVFREILRPFTHHPVLVGCCDVILCLLTAVSFFRLTGDWKNRLRILVLVMLVPLASNFVYVLSNGHYIITMRYPIVLYQVLIVMMLDLWLFRDRPFALPRLKKAFQAAAALLFAVIVLNNTIYSNQVYLKTVLEGEATLSAMTRLLVRMEDTEGYVPGETPVVLEGDLNHSAVSQTRPGYPEDNVTYAMQKHFAPRYHGAYKNYLVNVLGYPVRIEPLETTDRYAADPRVAAMPAFPDPGCCEMIDGMLIVKLSEDMEIQHDQSSWFHD